MVCQSHDGFGGPEIAPGIHATIAGSTKGGMELRDMNEKELRELDAWIAEHAMGWSRIEGIPGLPIYQISETSSRNFHPTTLSQDAMDVLKKCAAKLDCEDIKIGLCSDIWSIETVYREDPGARGRIRIWSLPPEKVTLELAICKFAKELFSK